MGGFSKIKNLLFPSTRHVNYMIDVHEILDKETAYLFEKCAAEAVDILNDCDYIPEILKYFAYLNRPDVHEVYVARNNAEPQYTTVLLCTNHKIRCLFHKLTGDEPRPTASTLCRSNFHISSHSLSLKRNCCRTWNLSQRCHIWRRFKNTLIYTMSFPPRALH